MCRGELGVFNVGGEMHVKFLLSPNLNGCLFYGSCLRCLQRVLQPSVHQGLKGLSIRVHKHLPRLITT